jgi:hypothetical protein
MAELGIFTLLLGGVIVAKSKRASATALTIVVAAYLASAIIHVLLLGG